MGYFFINSETGEKNYLELPDCTIQVGNKQYVVENETILIFDIIDGKPSENGKPVKNITLSDKNLSLFMQMAKNDEYNSILDVGDTFELSKKDFKKNYIREIYGDKKDIRIKKARVKKGAFSFSLKDKHSDEKTDISFKVKKESFWEFLKQKLRIKNKIKFKTPKKEYVVNGKETLEDIAQEYDVPVKKLLKANKKVHGLTKEDISTPLKEDTTIIIPKTKHVTKIKENNIDVVPEHEYIVEEKEQLPATVANKFGISQYRLLKANPQLIMHGKNIDNYNPHEDIRALRPGEKLIIPKHRTILKLEKISLESIAEETGVSETYIEDILIGFEKRNTDHLTPYYDNVKDAKHSKGYLTIGLGHTGIVFGQEMNSKNKDSIKITEAEEYLILARDILAAKETAEEYFGEDFNKAPHSIQEGIIDMIFNKGVEAFTRKDSPSQNLKDNLKNKDYVNAAANMIVDPTNVGLMRRNVHRVILSCRDLNPKKQQESLELAHSYYEQTIAKLQAKKTSARIAMEKELKSIWEEASNGKVVGVYKKDSVVVKPKKQL